MKKTMVLAAVLVLSGFLSGTTQGFQVKSETAPAGPAASQKEATALSSEVCPRYRWMNWGSYFSYYAQDVSACNTVNFNSTASNLPSSGNCTSGGAGCYPTFTKTGLLISRTDDPGMNGYGHGVAGPEGRKRGRLLRGPNNRPWPGQSTRLDVTHFDDFEIEFLSPDGGTVLQAQVMIIDARIEGSPEPKEKLGRALEILPFSNPRPPVNGSVGDVEPVSGRPHAYMFTYTPMPTNGSAPVPVDIEIITHHQTPGH